MEHSRIADSIGVALDRFIKDKQEQFQFASGELSQLLRDIALASKVVNREVNKAGLIDIMGGLGSQNSAGDDQQKLDMLAHIRFSRALAKGGEVAALISEETESFEDLSNDGKYIVAMDPLDGSSNIDVNVSIGTIFSVYRRRTPIGTPIREEDILQRGTEQVAAGYILYGSSTMLVYTTGHGVNGFTYEQDMSIIEPILKLDVRECYEDLKDRRTSALTILACKEFGAQKGEILKHATIVDNARDKSSVVIYGSIVFA